MINGFHHTLLIFMNQCIYDHSKFNLFFDYFFWKTYLKVKSFGIGIKLKFSDEFQHRFVDLWHLDRSQMQRKTSRDANCHQFYLLKKKQTLSYILNFVSPHEKFLLRTFFFCSIFSNEIEVKLTIVNIWLLESSIADGARFMALV